jgi:hypothetical protein
MPFEMIIGVVVMLMEGLRPLLKFIPCLAEVQAHLPVQEG